MSDWASRARLRNRWRYTRAFLEELLQLTAAAFGVVAIVWISFVIMWAATCGLTVGLGPFCR